MVPSRVIGGLTQSPSTSGIFFQGDGQSFVNSSNSIPGTARSNLGPVSGDIHNGVLNSVANSGPSVGASSLVTDANSSLSGGPHLQRSQSTNNESYLCLPASPMSFTSNNISISGSSVMDGSTVVQQSSHQDQNTQLQQNQQGGSTATSLPTGGRLAGSYLHDPNNLSQKKPRLDVKQEDILPQQVLQQIFQRQDSARSPQIHAMFQHQRLRQQQQILQSMPQMQRAHMQQQQQQMLMRQQMQQQVLQPPATLKRPYADGGICSRRLMQYLYHQRQRPQEQENAIAYWRKFVAEYYSPRAKKRWCLSLYENVGHQALGVFPQAAMDAWQCDLCGSKSGRGFEATSEVLPRLNEIKFGSGVIDELLFVDMPREYRYPSGVMVLEYAKAVQESVYEQLRVVREGQLRIIFSQDLKILNWEFCARRHEELFPRRSVAPQVNQLVQVAQKCQTTISESGADGISQQDLQTNSNMVLNAGRQLSKSLELQSLNDLGFSKRYVRCLQISEVVNSMKDLIDFCREHKAGPIDGLKSYPRHSSAAKLQMQKMQEMEQLASAQGVPTDRTTLNKLMSLHPNQLNNANNHNSMVNNNMVNNNRGALSGSAQAALALSTYQNMLMKQNSNVSLHHQEASSSFPTPNQTPSSSYSPHHHQQQPPHQHPQPPPSHQQQQRSMSGPANMLQQNHHPQTPQGSASPTMHHHQMIQQLLQEMSNGNGPRNGMNFSGNGPAPVPANSGGPAASRSNSFKAAAASNSDSAGGFNQNLQDDIVPDIPSDFNDTSFFGSDLDDTMGYGWKA